MPGTIGGGTGSGGGGSTTGICIPSPTDRLSEIDNILDRLTAIEETLAQILSGDIHVNQISDIATQLGWVEVEYLGQPGWYQTEYGTLVPPPGFTFLGSGMTLSDGNTYQAVTYDSDGVLQFGFQTDGQVTGASAGGTTGNYIDYGWHNGNLSTYGNGGTVSTDSGETWRDTGNGGILITGMSPGEYLAIANVMQAVQDDSGTTGAVVNHLLTIEDTGPSKKAIAFPSAVVDANGDMRISSSVSAVFDISSTSEYIWMLWAANIVGGTITWIEPAQFNLTIIKLKN